MGFLAKKGSKKDRDKRVPYKKRGREKYDFYKVLMYTCPFFWPVNLIKNITKKGQKKYLSGENRTREYRNEGINKANFQYTRQSAPGSNLETK